MSAKIIKVVVSRKWMLSFNAGSCVSGMWISYFQAHLNTRAQNDTCSYTSQISNASENIKFPQNQARMSALRNYKWWIPFNCELERGNSGMS